ncbi:MAG: cystathionine beta-lyase [Rhodospirillales bacterium]|nr:cystathionine beta-lyase [Rhodospirillales bacterium]
MSDKKITDYQQNTLLAHAGLAPRENHGVVNPPVYHASTITFATMEQYETRDTIAYDGPSYGRSGTPTQFAFERAVTALHGGHKSVAYPSGLAAIAGAVNTFVKNGDHILVADTVYGPTRSRVCGTILARAGVDVEFYDALIGAGIKDLVRDNTVLVYMESPGSLTFEIQDVPAIIGALKGTGIVTMIDNTWASGYFFKPLAMGVDVVVEAATKYTVGHSDAMLGTVTVATENHYQLLKAMANSYGYHAAPDDCYLGQRGLRTIGVRLERHQSNALEVANWLQSRDEVARVMYPALPSDPGYKIWKRDFAGASGLMGVELVDAPKAAVAAMIDSYDLFGIGASWGGYESLVQSCYPAKIRSARPWTGTGPTVRFHIGLEDTVDLIENLSRGFEKFNAARK